MTVHTPLRLNAVEEGLLAQLDTVGAHDLAARLRETGLPTRRIEAYHYTDLRQLLGAVPPLAGKAIVGAGPFRLPGARRILIANGVAESLGEEMPGITVSTAPGAVALAEDEDMLVALNRALQGEALTIAIEGEDDRVIHIDRRIEGEAAHAVSATRITVAPGARVTIFETITGSDAAHWGNAGTSIEIGEGARVSHVILDRAAAASTQFATLQYRLAENAHLHSLAVHAGSDLSRIQVFARFEGAGAHADFRGLNLADNGQHSDISLDIAHAVPNTTSTERYKQIGRGRSKSVFQGKIVVARDAQKTDAQMMTQGLILSDEAEILAKPELEIFADDVICAHGATCGDLDETALFYLMSRGIPRAEAETILVRAFLAEVFDELDNEALADLLNGVVDAWLDKAAA